MLSERQLEALLLIFEQRMQKVVDQYLRDMGEHLKAIGQLLPSDVNRLVELKRVNANVNHIKREIGKAAGLSVQDIEKVFTAVAASDYEFMSKYYGEARQLPIRKNKSILRILQAQARVTSQELANLSQTTILSEGYRRAVDVAIQTAQAGVTDYNTAIRSALKEAAKEGLRVRYPNSGLTRRLDTAVRMNVLDGIRALNNDVLEQTGKEFGADGIELSAHALCAEDHLPYQGRQFSMEEFETIQMRLRRPIGMWNCKHTRHPIILGISESAYSPEQLERLRRNSSQEITIDGETKTRYEWTQEQRRIETAIRRQNDVVTAAKAAGDNVSRLEAQKNITDLIARYDYVSEKAGLELRYDRTVGAAVYRNNSSIELPKLVERANIKTAANREWLRKGYQMAVRNGDISALTGFDHYMRIAEEVEQKIVGITTSDGIPIKGYVTHFIDRVIGGYERKREPVSITAVREALLNPQQPIVRKRPNGKPPSNVYKTDECSVSVNPNTGLIIQTSPKQKGESV